MHVTVGHIELERMISSINISHLSAVPADRPQHWNLPEDYEFVDVLGLDPELLGLVTRPVHAVVFLFPDTETIVDHRTKEGPGTPAARGQEPLWIPQVGVGKRSASGLPASIGGRGRQYNGSSIADSPRPFVRNLCRAALPRGDASGASPRRLLQ